MSDLPVPAALAILVVVLLVLIVLIVLIARGRRSGPDADAATSPDERAPSSEEPGSPQDTGPDLTAPGEARATEDAEGAPAADEDPRPWRERHGRRASRPLLGQDTPSDAASWEVSPEQSTDHRG